MNRQKVLLVLAMMISMLTATAQTFSASFTNANPRQAVAILREATGYDFVYQKTMLDKNPSKVNGRYTNLPISQLLERTVVNQLGLSF